MISTKDDEPLWKRLKRTSGEMRFSEDSAANVNVNPNSNSNSNSSNNNDIRSSRPYSTPIIRMPNPLLITNPSPTLSLTATTTSTSSSASHTKSTTNHTTHLTMMHQQHQLETLQMQMEHERDKNRLEQKKLQNSIDKLQQQLDLSTKELQQQNELYNETQENYDKQIQDLTTAHRNTLQQNRQLQLQIEQLQYHHINRPQRRWRDDNDAAAGCIPNAKDDATGDNDDEDDYNNEEEQDDLNNDEMIDAELQTYQVLNQRLQKQIQNYAHNETIYQQEIQQLKQVVQDKLQSLQDDHDTKKKVQDENDKLYEEAPKTILQELNTCRIQLATSERHVRQFERQRKYELQQYTSLLQEHETLKLQSQRYGQIQEEYQELHKKYSQMEAENTAYFDFSKQVHFLIRNDINNRHCSTDNSINNTRGPPELATIIRFLDNAKRHSTNSTKLGVMCPNDVPPHPPVDDNRNDSSKLNTTSSNAESIQWAKQQREYENEIRTLQKKYEITHHQMVLYQREIESYKSLMQTYEQQMILLSPATVKQQNVDANYTKVTPSSNSNHNVNVEFDSLKIEHGSLKDLYEHLQQSNNAVISELNACRNELNTKQSDYDQLRVKYQQIKDAIQVEKERRTALEQQLIVAEQLAGKGSFDPERTRILHITETPLIQALKEEITVLKRQVDTLLQQKQNITSSPSDAPVTLLSTSSTTTMPNPEKVIQRLKEQFKEQIGMFREGVYIMTGFKIDMITNTQPSTNTATTTLADDGTSSKPRPTFRLRSVFAEHEEDQLLLQWPTNEMSSTSCNNKSLDILQTDFAKYLSTTNCYDYIAKLHSIPAFLASVQLMLFEKQTIMM